MDLSGVTQTSLNYIQKVQHRATSLSHTYSASTLLKKY